MLLLPVLFFKVLGFPIWLLWRLQLLIWWAFADAPAARGTPRWKRMLGLGAPLSTSSHPPPLSALKWAFGGALAGSVAAALAAISVVNRETTTSLGGVLLWAWLTLAGQVASVVLLRRFGRRSLQSSSNPAPRQPADPTQTAPTSPGQAGPSPAAPTAAFGRRTIAGCGRVTAAGWRACRTHGPSVVAFAGSACKAVVGRVNSVLRRNGPTTAP